MWQCGKVARWQGDKVARWQGGCLINRLPPSFGITSACLVVAQHLLLYLWQQLSHWNHRLSQNCWNHGKTIVEMVCLGRGVPSAVPGQEPDMRGNAALDQHLARVIIGNRSIACLKVRMCWDQF